MAKLDLLLEAERRGILPEDKKPLLEEARRRGLVPRLEGSTTPATATAVKGEAEPVPAWGTKNPRLYGVYGAAKEVAKETGKLALEGTLMTAGAVGGAAIGNLPGAIAMGGAGYGLARGIERKLAGGDQRVRGEDVLLGAGMTAGGEVIGAGARALGRAVIPSKADFELANWFKQKGIEVLPSATRAEPSKSLGILESLLGFSPFSGDVMVKKAANTLAGLNDVRAQLIERGASTKQIEEVGMRIKQEAKTIIEAHEGVGTARAKKALDDFMSHYPSTTQFSAGSSVKDMLEATRLRASQEVSSRYAQVQTALSGQAGETFPVSDATTALAKRALDEELAKAPSLRNTSIMKVLRDFMPTPAEVNPDLEMLIKGRSKSFLDKNPQLAEMVTGAGAAEPKSFTWTGMDKNRSELLERVRSILTTTKGMPTNESRIYSELADSIDTDMAAAGEQLGGDIKSLIDEARAGSRAYHEVFDKDVLSIMHRKPEQVFNAIRGDVSSYQRIKAAIGPSGIQPMKEWLMGDIIESSIDRNGVVDAARVARRISGIKPEIFNDMFTLSERQTLQSTLKESSLIARKYFGNNKLETVKFLKTITGVSSEKVVDYLFKPNNTQNIKLAQRLFSPERLKEVQEQAISKVLAASSDNNFLPITSARNFKKYEAPLRQLLPASTYKEVKTMVLNSQHLKKIEALAQNASQTGQVFIGYEIAKALQTHPINTARSLGMTWAIAKMYTNETAMTYLKKALIYPANHSQAIANFTRAGQIVMEHNLRTDSDNPTPVVREGAPQ